MRPAMSVAGLSSDCRQASNRSMAASWGQLSRERTSLPSAARSRIYHRQRMVSHQEQSAFRRRTCRCSIRMHARTDHAAPAQPDNTARSSPISEHHTRHRDPKPKLSRLHAVRGMVLAAAAAASTLPASLADAANAASDQPAAATSSSCGGIGCAQELLDSFGASPSFKAMRC